MKAASSVQLEKILASLTKQEPFSLLTSKFRDKWFEGAELKRCDVGYRLLRPDELPNEIYLIVSGEMRLLVPDPQGVGPITFDKRGPGQLLGWVGLTRGAPCEWVSATCESIVLSLRADYFIQAFLASTTFADFFKSLPVAQESYAVALAASDLSPQLKADWYNKLSELSAQASAITVEPSKPFKVPSSIPNSSISWYLSTSNVPGMPMGSSLANGMVIPEIPGYQMPYRCVGFPSNMAINLGQQLNNKGIRAMNADNPPTNLQQLGILEADDLEDKDYFPICRGSGPLEEGVAVSEMISLYFQTPFRKDSVRKALDGHIKRDKSLSIELLGGICESIGFSTQLADINPKYFLSVEAPAILFLEEHPVIYYGSRGNKIILADPQRGLRKLALSELITQIPTSKVRLALPKRTSTTPRSRFGWSWFTPLLFKYRSSLALIFVASLLAQLFGLGIPLLIQQIIDKVLSQGNLSSLNVLGTAMVVMALFQGILTALRTYIFVDTTDRMDLTLGSSVIDRLLSLPLKYYEKRPVGELSQRLGELNTIRGFLTGTALTSVLNIIFSAMYLVVMLVYSPLLSAVALSTLPFYIIMVVGLSPIYKSLIRKRAVAQARTQSHLIEVISGIQTVKAQHFELTSRWKWQDRYRVFVSEGFKSVALGSTSSEVGKFLNQISGLLVLWVGMWLVLKGELTLGMLIAFRIISSNVTGPLLQLATLYQGFQGVQLSMERLSDIVDQNPEMSTQGESGQIPLPNIQGAVRFEDVRFRFGNSGPYQVNDVTIDIPAGGYIGIVGQSGSGKSTLMKLLARLYELEKGRIFIDDYDIAKIDLSSLRRQIGIVPQDSLLFEGTIAENIALNDPNASTESIIEAAKIACAHDFIMSLGQGYATPIAERGGNLSGGQRQRIAIARTVLSNPRLLVMDEATSALDYSTEKQLCLNLQKWAKNRTVFFITHRLTTIQESTLILLMDQGRLVEYGTHDEMIKNKKRYYSLYNQQST
ncbi:peptidase domain-containing ABC transporter [Synechococcus sp. GEYO]|uniref:peptidase domain-containing ABC transporter n=1 Tax=Synechococcus sp. GEYO TaxID=2575511 RepID=UPI000E0EF76B|nr:peptidase domain-containing ABC transporter [Synechococcus sp. GEYO]